jgi:molecular chaperone GrpE
MNEQSKNEKKESLNLKKQENLVKEKKLSDKDKNTQKKVKNNQDVLVDELKLKLKDTEDKLLRSLAENDNLRKRHDKEIEDNSKYAIKNLSYSLLNVADNLQRALESIPNMEASGSDDNIIKNLIVGIKAVEKELIDSLEKHGVTKFDSINQKFNPEIHQAVSKVHNEKVDGTIVEEMQKGFKIGDRLLRPAMVVVSMGPEIKK